MITKQDLIDAIRAFSEDVTDGRWPPDDLAHSAIIALSDRLPDAPEPGDAHPDLIDRDSDTWRWYAGYDLSDPGLCSRADVERNFGPVRDAPGDAHPEVRDGN